MLQGLLAGGALGAIASRLQLRAKTVSNHQSLIRRKLGVGTGMELFRHAQRHHLFQRRVLHQSAVEILPLPRWRGWRAHQ